MCDLIIQFQNDSRSNSYDLIKLLFAEYERPHLIYHIPIEIGRTRLNLMLCTQLTFNSKARMKQMHQPKHIGKKNTLNIIYNCIKPSRFNLFDKHCLPKSLVIKNRKLKQSILKAFQK